MLKNNIGASQFISGCRVLLHTSIQYIFREDVQELFEGWLMIGFCRVRMSLLRDIDFFFFIQYLHKVD